MDNCQGRSLILQQGNSYSGSILLNQGQTYSLEQLIDSQLTIASAHCLKAGMLLHVVGKTDCCQIVELTYEVVEVAGELLEVQKICGPTLDAPLTEGWVSQSMDIRGFSLVGMIASRRVTSPAIQSLGCVSVGSNQVLLRGNPDMAIGDAVTMPTAGIANAIVTGVFDSAPAAGSKGCCGTASSSGASETIVTLDKLATASISCDNPAQISFTARVLGQFNFEMDTRCGRATYSLAADWANDLTFADSSCGDDAYHVGCYQIAIRNAPPDNPGYPPRKASWQRTIAHGQAFLKPSLF